MNPASMLLDFIARLRSLVSIREEMDHTWFLGQRVSPRDTDGIFLLSRRHNHLADQHDLIRIWPMRKAPRMWIWQNHNGLTTVVRSR